MSVILKWDILKRCIWERATEMFFFFFFFFLNVNVEEILYTQLSFLKCRTPSRKHAYIILTPLNPTFI